MPVFDGWQGHGGTVAIESELGKSATVRIWLPTATDTAGKTDGDRAGETEAKHALKVLLVEDDADVRQSTALLLAAIGCEVIETGRAAPVVEFLENDDGIDLLISDIVLPGGKRRRSGAGGRCASFRPNGDPGFRLPGFDVGPVGPFAP